MTEEPPKTLDELIEQFSQPVKAEVLRALFYNIDEADFFSAQSHDVGRLCAMLEMSEDRKTVQISAKYRTQGQANDGR